MGGLHLVTGRRLGRLGGAARGGLRAGGASLPQRPREPACQRARMLLPPTSRLLPRALRALALCGARAREAGARAPTRPAPPLSPAGLAPRLRPSRARPNLLLRLLRLGRGL